MNLNGKKLKAFAEQSAFAKEKYAVAIKKNFSAHCV